MNINMNVLDNEAKTTKLAEIATICHELRYRKKRYEDLLGGLVIAVSEISEMTILAINNSKEMIRQLEILLREADCKFWEILEAQHKKDIENG